jgi:membrane-associated progesterone receptor component
MMLLLLVSLNSVAAFVSPNDVSRHHHKSKQSNTITQINAIDPSFIAGGIAITGATAAWWILGAQDRENKEKYAEYEALQLEREKLAFIETRETPWLEEELKAYNGENDPSGPILLAVKGDVFNVWKGRNFYGPDGEYHIMAGRDATRFLAKNRLEEETEDEKKVPLNIAERASLEGWYWTIKNKYQFVGNLAGYDPTSTEM